MAMNQGIDVQSPPDVGLTPPGHAESGARAMGETVPAVRKPSPYEDDELLLKTFEECRRESWDNRWAYERVWWRNLLYLLNRQWIRYDQQRGTWVDKRLAKWVPRPVTNKVLEAQNAIQAVFQAVQLGVTVKPNGNRPLDVTTAEVADALHPAIRAEHDMDANQLVSDFWLIATGNVFWHPWWDKKAERGVLTVPLEMCVYCMKPHHPADIYDAGNKCPSCGQRTFMQAQNPDGSPLVDTMQIGMGRTDIMSPFELAVPGHATSIEEAEYVIRKRWRPKTWYQRYYPQIVEKAELQWERMPLDRSLQLLKGIAAQSELQSSTLSFVSGEFTELEGITEYELWRKPDKTFSEGLVLRVAGEGKGSAKVIRLDDQGMPGQLPYETQSGQKIIPFVHTRYDLFGGRLFGRSPHDAQIQKQDQINQLDSLTQLIVTRTANPIWLEPKGAEVQKFTGEPGLVVKYNPNLAGQNARPERIPGENIPPSLVTLRKTLFEDMENGYGTYDLIKGQKPAGVEAFSAIQALIEQAQTRFTTPLAHRGIAYRKWYGIALELERQFGPLERTWSVLGPNGSWAFEEFRNADLQGAITVQIEDGSQVPKTSLGKRAAIEQLVNWGVISTQNPETAYRILQVTGQPDMWPGLDADVKNALQEQDAFERWAARVEQVPTAPQIDPATGMMSGPGWTFSEEPPGRVRVWNNDLIHLAEHKKWANGDAVRRILETKPWIEPAIDWLILQHEQRVMATQAPVGALPPAGETSSDGKGVGAGRAMERSNAESGNTADVPSGTNEVPNANMGPV